MFYIEITLLPTVEIPLNFLWNKMYAKIHLEFVTLQREQEIIPIGVSFPEYTLSPPSLGKKLRLFTQESQVLDNFIESNCLKIFSGYYHATGIREVPEKLQTYVAFRRVQPKNNKERLARRKARRQNISYEQALEQLKDFDQQSYSLPYIIMKSTSSNKKFSLFIKKEEMNTQNTFKFSTYGLYKGGLVPDFN
ncbi:MAG: type I-F CRISPR-associated endoribonuclease Cas6/Csy4 [Bacilli bacterium]|jgi:CRISPR-associated endonuclease Csy4